MSDFISKLFTKSCQLSEGHNLVSD